MDDGRVTLLGGLSLIALVVIVLGLLNFYIWARAIRSTTRRGSRGRRIGTWLIVLAFLSVVLAQIAIQVFPAGISAPLAWVGFSWLGFAFYFILFLLVGELVRLGLRIRGQRAPSAAEVQLVRPEPVAVAAAVALPTPPSGSAEPADPPTVERDHREVPRRLFLSRSIALGAGVAAASVAGYGISRAMGDPVIRRVPVQIVGLDPRLAGFTIAMFSDAHLGSIRRKSAMEQIVESVNSAEPDLIAVVGDLIDGTVAELGRDVAPIEGLRAPHGSFFVTGNHEYYSGFQEWMDYLPDHGVRVLDNQRVAIERDGGIFDLAGITDITGEDYGDTPDYDRALGGRDIERPVVLLCHQPVNVAQAVEHGVDLQLSGHTHGGQVWPFHYIANLQQGAVSGLSRIEATQLYVTSGTGFWGPPMRVGADPEVVVIELQPREPAA